MQKTGPLLRTKLHPPFIRPGIVSRPRLQAQVVEGLHYPLALVVAPAGFGKTTLVASSLASSQLPHAWISLDKDDNQPGRFLLYLVAALQGTDPRIGGDATELMMGIRPAQPEAVLTSLVNDLDGIGTEIALVLDDYQFINSQSVHEALGFLLEHCPYTFHILIATRSDPALPVARLRARGQMVELRASDLRFTPAEAAQFLNEVMGLRLDEGSVSLLEERTEGWVAGLQMAALSMRDRQDVRGFIEGFSGTNRHILDYLLEEILAGQPPEIQRFLLTTSILGRLAAPLCDAILVEEELSSPGSEDSQPFSGVHHPSATVLEYLDRENLFLISLDDERTWFRYHHLFADLLKARLQKTQPVPVHRLHLQASAWFEQNGYILEAIQHLLAAGEIGRAADLIERYAPLRLAESDPSILQMADSLPPDTILAHPKIGLYRAWHLIILGKIQNALPLLHDLANQLASADPQAGQQWMQAIIATARAFLAPPTRPPGDYPLPDYSDFDEIPADEPILRNAADYLYGMALARRAELNRAIEISLKNIQRERISQSNQLIPTLAPFLTRIYLMQGRLSEVSALCREFLDPIRKSGSRFIYTGGSMKIDLGEVLYERNCLEEAELLIREGLQANEPWRNIMTDGFGLAALARVLKARGDYAGALQAAEKFTARLKEHSRPREFDEDFYTLSINIQLAKGDLQSAAQWADQVQAGDESRIQVDIYRFMLARIRLAQGNFAAVDELLGGKTPSHWLGNQINRQIERNLLLAAAAAGQQRNQQALEFVEAALGLAETEGYIQIFLEVSDPARDLLAAYLRQSEPGHKPYAETVLGVFSPAKAARSIEPQTTGLVEPMSQRELEVLQLMALGLTNQEIAGQLIISPGTVKAHTASIYRKLDVANRTEAVNRARQLKLLT